MPRLTIADFRARLADGRLPAAYGALARVVPGDLATKWSPWPDAALAARDWTPWSLGPART